MRITSVREITVPLESNVANAFVNFSEHTISLVVLETDVVRNGKPVIGYAFDSIGRFAQGGMLRGLHVDGARMRRNLDLTGRLIVAETVMMGIVPAIGRQHAHDVVYDACRVAIEQGRTLYDVLAGNAQIRERLDDARLRALTDPANYLGAAAHMARAVASSRRDPASA